MKSILKFWFYLFNWTRIHDALLLTPFEKRDRLVYFAQRTEAANFVETGSYHGDTAKELAKVVDRVVTIEIDAANAETAKRNCSAFQNISVRCGPSEKLLEELISDLRGPTLFWLDAHYQMGMTKGNGACPLFEELRIIFSHPNIAPTILIDDARKFLWINGWPSLSSIRQYVESYGYSFRVSHDMICIGRFSM